MRRPEKGTGGSFPTTPPYSLRQGLSFESRALIFHLGCQLASPSNPPASALPHGWGCRCGWNCITPLARYVCIGAGSESEHRAALLVGKASLQAQVLAFKPPSRRDHPSLLGKAPFSQGLMWPRPLMGQYSSSISFFVNFFLCAPSKPPGSCVHVLWSTAGPLCLPAR